eukprot:s425_g30.t1
MGWGSVTSGEGPTGVTSEETERGEERAERRGVAMGGGRVVRRGEADGGGETLPFASRPPPYTTSGEVSERRERERSAGRGMECDEKRRSRRPVAGPFSSPSVHALGPFTTPYGRDSEPRRV